MKKTFKILAIVSLLCMGFGAQAQGVRYTYTPKKIYDYWVSKASGFCDTVSTGQEKPDGSINPTLSNGKSYTYKRDGFSYIDIRSATYSGVCDSGVNLSIGHNNSTLLMFPFQDSMWSQATENFSVEVTIPAAINRKAESKKVLFEGSSTNNDGRLIQITCGTDTIHDTIWVAGRHVLSYRVKNAGQQKVKFTTKKALPNPGPYDFLKGNFNFFRLEVVDNNLSLNTPVLPLRSGTVAKLPMKEGYDKNESVQITANPAAGYTFTSWSDGQTNAVRTVVMDDDVTLTARFTAIDYKFNATVNNTTMGSVTVKEGVVLPTTTAHVNDVFTLTAVPSLAKYRFVKWEDNSTNPKRTFTMPAKDTIAMATFEDQPKLSVNITVSPSGAGTVTDEGRIMREALHQYYNGDIVDMKATPNAGYEFVNWSDGSDDPEHAVRIVGDSAVKITANFRTATANPPVPTPHIDPIIKVDFDISGRQTKEVTEPGFNSWVVSSTDVVKTIDDITFTMTKEGDVGKGFRSTWDKLTVQAPYYARLVGDGIAVDMSDLDADLYKGTQMSMKIEGLNKGTHSMLLYLNNTDATRDAKTGDTVLFSPVNVYLNGNKIASVMQSNRAASTDEAASLFFEFPVRELEDIVIYLESDLSPITHATHNIPDTVNFKIIRTVTLSAFILNDPNPEKQAWSPTPNNRDEHINSKGAGDKVMLSWRPAREGATRHHVYLGSEFLEIDAADKTSPLYKGAQTDTTYLISNVNVMESYYWRVDEEKNGEITKGDVWYFRPRVLAFPGAEGYGKWARGARGGKVVYVTNLKNDGAGSLRELTGSGDNDLGPRYILFAVSGRIHLNPGARITLNNPYVTVAGQTAPGKGVCISGASYGVSGGQDVIVRFMRVRVGQFGETIDGMGMSGANYSIMDHNTISWTHDEAFSSRGGKNFTLQNTLIAEALNVANHKNYSYGSGHGYAATIGGDTASFLRNLLVHNQGRNWSLGGGLYGDGYYSGHLDLSNNVVYNYGGRVTDGGAHEVNFVNNYYKAGKNSTSGMLKAQHEGVGKGTQKYYYAGNVNEAYNSGNYGVFTCDGVTNQLCGYSDQWAAAETRYTATVDEPFFPSHATVLPAKHAFKSVISNSGANMPVTDENDLRNILEARDGTWTYQGSFRNSYDQGIIDHHLDVGGYEKYPEVTLDLDEFDTDRDGLPNWWEKEVTKTNPNGVIGDYTDTNTDPDNDGNTYMERYLEFMATPHVTTVKKQPVSVELSQYTRGYIKSPVYTVESNGDGVVTINGNWARFQPNASFAGVTYFTFKVTDSDGDTMVRKIGVRVVKQQ